jgi:hypothetical protein
MGPPNYLANRNAPPTMLCRGRGGALLPPTFYGSKAGATFCPAMISIGSGLNSGIATLSQHIAF